MLKKNLLLILVSLCVITALISEQQRRTEVIGGSQQQEALTGVSNDGWTDANFTVLLGTRVATVPEVKLTLDPYRPRGAPRVKVSLVNCPEATLITTADALIVKDAWNCSKELKFEADKTFKLPDDRRVGVKLRGLRYSSGWNVLDSKFVSAYLMLLTLSLLAFFILSKKPLPSFVLAMVVQIFMAATNAHQYWDSGHEFNYLSVLVASFLIGLWYFGRPASNQTNPDISTKTFFYALAVITVFGLSLRFYGIHFGLPNFFHPDEPRKARIALRFLTTGNLDPDYFLHPTLLLYLTALFGKIGTLLGWITDPTRVAMIVCGRTVSILAGSISIVLCALCARILSTKRTALLAAALVAFSPLTVTCSRYLKEDALVLCMLLTCMLFCLLAATKENRKVLYVALACLFAGFAAGSKYSGIVCVGFVGMTPWLASKKLLPDKKLFITVCFCIFLAPVGFLITTPYSVITPDKFIAGFNSEKRHMEVGHDSVQVWASHRFWLFHGSRSLTDGIGFWVVPVLGLLLAEAYRRRSFTLLFVMGCFLLFYLPAEYVKTKPEPQPERYVLPCVALLALAISTSSFFNKGSKKKFIVTSAILLIPPALMSLRLAEEIYPDTRILMRQFILNKIKPGKTILVDAAIYSAPLPGQIYHLVGMDSKEDRESATPEWLREHKINYVLLTSQSWQRYFSSRITNRLIRSRYRVLLNRLILVKEMKADYKSYGFHNPTLRLYRVN